MAHDLAFMAPYLVVALLTAFILAFRRRDGLVLAPLAVLGGGLAFDLIGFYLGSIGSSFRYFIAAIPLGIMVVGVILSARPSGSTRTNWAVPVMTVARAGIWGAGASMVLVLLLVGPSVITTGIGMLNPAYGQEESPLLTPIVKHEPQGPTTFIGETAIAAYLDSLHLPNGDIVIDNSVTCVPGIITNVANPKIFVIPNDRDFMSVLSDPKTFHADYVMLTANYQAGASQTNALYPSLFQNGQGFAHLFHQFPSDGCPTFRLYRVITHTPTP